MANTAQRGEVLPPGVNYGPSDGPQRRGTRMLGRGSGLFDNENLDLLARVLDDCFTVPFTNFKFGIDGIIGLIPGVGDALAGMASLLLIVAAWVRGVPYVTLLRMGANVGIAVLIGSVPLVGDAFDVWWKPNRRNYKLLTAHLENPRRSTFGDRIALLSMVIGLLVVLCLPFWVLIFLYLHYAHH